LNIIDDFNREILSICIDTSLPSAKVISELEKLIEWRGKPEKIRVCKSSAKSGQLRPKN
jgi:putative transposase